MKLTLKNTWLVAFVAAFVIIAMTAAAHADETSEPVDTGTTEAIITETPAVTIEEAAPEVLSIEAVSSDIAEVSNLDDLKTALSDAAISTININAAISTSEKLLVNRPVIINGHGNTITFTGDTPEWQGNYVLQVYSTTDVSINDLGLTGGDAALLINGSAVSLSGTITVSGNEFGGIEVSKGSTGINGSLNLSGTLKDDTESYGHPALWKVNGEGTVTGGPATTSTLVKSTQTQYYVKPDNASTVTVTNDAELTAALARADITTINLVAGTYAGNIIVTHGVALKAATGTIIHTGSPAIVVNTTDAVTIDGFTFNGTGRPIGAIPASNLIINNNIFTNTVGDASLYFADNATFVFTNNTLDTVSEDSADAIFMAGNWDGTNGTVVTITGNTFKNSLTSGMNLSNVSGTVSNNIFTNIPYYGILVANKSSLIISGNTFDGIKVGDDTVSTYGAGVRFYNPTAPYTVSITGNTFKNSVIGIAVRPSNDLAGSSITVNHNTFSNNTSDIKDEGTGILDVSGNYNGGISPVATGTGASNVKITNWYTDALMTKLNTDPVATSGGGGGGGVSGGGGAVFTATTPATSTVTTTAPVGQVLGAETFNFTKTLKMGATGDEVVQLQNRLATDGYTLVNDGKFGPKTKAALIKWQKAHGLVADGVVGPKTRAALNK